MFTLKRVRPAWVLWAFGLWSCANPGQNSGDAAKPVDPARPAPAPMPSTADSKPNLGKRILVSLKAPEAWKDVTGYVVAAGDTQSMLPAADLPGRYSFSLLKAGTYDLIVEAKEAHPSSGPERDGVAVRLSGIELRSDRDTWVRDVELFPYRTLTGRVRLSDGSPAAGATVQLVDSALKTEVASDGTFVLNRVPQGQHSFSVKLTGHTPGVYERRLVRASEELATLTLLPEDRSLLTGVHFFGDPVPPLAATDITLFLVRPQGMDLFRWGFTPDLNQSAWIPYQSAYDVRIPAGQRSVYVQFSQDRTQLSSTYSVSLPLP